MINQLLDQKTYVTLMNYANYKALMYLMDDEYERDKKLTTSKRSSAINKYNKKKT